MQGIAYKIGQALHALGEYALMAAAPFVATFAVPGCATTKESTASKDVYVPPEDSMPACKEYIERTQIGFPYDENVELLKSMLSNCEHYVEESFSFYMCLSSAVFDTTAVGAELDSMYFDCFRIYFEEGVKNALESEAPLPKPATSPAPSEPPAPSAPSAPSEPSAPSAPSPSFVPERGTKSKYKVCDDSKQAAACEKFVESCIKAHTAGSDIVIHTDGGDISAPNVESCVSMSPGLAAMGFKLR